MPLKTARLAVNGPGDVMPWGAVELGYGPPCTVPYWKETLTLSVAPRFVRVPFSVAEFVVTDMAFPVETDGGIPDVVKLISFP